MWRADDEHLLQRLEDESVADALFRALVNVDVKIHPRASGIVAELRKVPLGTEAVVAARSGDVERLLRFVDGLVLPTLSPELLHHLALFHRRAALVLEDSLPDEAANAWVRSMAAWLALAEERTYLGRLETNVLAAAEIRAGRGAWIPPEQVPLEQLREIADHAKAASRDLGSSGRAALAALARTDEAASMARASEDATRAIRRAAEGMRNAVIEAALAVIGESLDDARARGELAAAAGTLLLRAIPVWTWTSNDEAVEHFVVDRIDAVAWELYRARSWDSLGYLLDPFAPMFERLATRIESDPSRIAYAAACAQMFVFRSEMEKYPARKLALAERAVRICPTHRNGRLILASVLCDQAIETMRGFGVVARKRDVERIEALLARVESVYPQSKDLPEAQKMLAQVKRRRVTL